MRKCALAHFRWRFIPIDTLSRGEIMRKFGWKMNIASRAQIAVIFDQLRVLRESVQKLQDIEEKRTSSLRGQQTTDDGGAISLSFLKLQQDIVEIEEVLATIAEATGDIPKL